MVISGDEKILIYSALFHDIGKLNYGQNRPHEMSGSDFIEACKFLSSEEREKIKNLIENHHITRSGRKLEEIENNLLRILIEADHLSAGMERVEKREEDIGDRYTQPLISPFSEVRLCENEKKEFRYPAVIINEKFLNGSLELVSIEKTEAIVNSRIIVKEDYSGKSLKVVYDEITKKLKEELNRTNLDINTLLTILKIYLQFIPSATYKDIPDIPLYDHLKTTAAIALSLYKSKNREKPFLLIGGDLSGIQNFIFSHFRTLESDKKAAKRLRGRSFYVTLLMDAVVRYIQKELELYDFSILWTSGGNFVVLAPNLEENKKKLEQIKEDINSELYRKYGNLYLSISWEEGTSEDIKNFSKFLDRLYEKIEEEKNKKYFSTQEILKNSMIEVPPKEICFICGRNKGFEKEERFICKYCEELENIGDKIRKAKYLVINPDLEADITFDIGISYKLSRNFEKGELVYGINYFSNNLNGFKLCGIYTPGISFGQIVDKEKDIKLRKSLEEGGKPTKLGLLKADVDNLGLIFSLGFENEKITKSISRLTFLSFLFDYFFSTIINKLAEKHNIYILFSGGDDLIAAGRFDEIIQFTKELNNKFSDFVKNTEITISCGIEIGNYKFPIKRFADYATERLKESKKSDKATERLKESKKDKNKITLFNSTVSWEQFEEELIIAKELYKMMSENKVGTGFLYYLLRLKENCFNKTILENTKMILNPEPYIRYNVYRNFNCSKEEKNKIINLILKKENENINNFKYINICVSLVSLLNRYKIKYYGI